VNECAGVYVSARVRVSESCVCMYISVCVCVCVCAGVWLVVVSAFSVALICDQVRVCEREFERVRESSRERKIWETEANLGERDSLIYGFECLNAGRVRRSENACAKESASALLLSACING
jgi:hypothetical protein